MTSEIFEISEEESLANRVPKRTLLMDWTWLICFADWMLICFADSLKLYMWDKGCQDIELINRVPKKPRKGFSSIKIKEGDLAKLFPLWIIGPITHTRGTGSSTDGLGNMQGIEITSWGSYNQVEQQRALRTSADSSSPEPVDGNDQITYQMENIVSVQGRDGGATPDIDCDFDLTPDIGRTRGAIKVGIFSQASNSVEGQEASSNGYNEGSGAGSGSDESDQSTGSDGTDTNEGINRCVGGDEHDEGDRDEGNDEDRRRVGELESGTRRGVWNSISTGLVAIFTSISVQSTSAIIALSLDGLSPLAKKLFTGVLVTNLLGFLCLYVALIPSRYISSRAAEILVRVGGAASAFGFLLMMGIRLSLGIIFPACVVILAAFVLSFMP